jgi:hypothetical protein
MQARVNIWRSIKSGSVWDSKWWLEKKDSSFINKAEIKVTDYKFTTNLED